MHFLVLMQFICKCTNAHMKIIMAVFFICAESDILCTLGMWVAVPTCVCHKFVFSPFVGCWLLCLCVCRWLHLVAVPGVASPKHTLGNRSARRRTSSALIANFIYVLISFGCWPAPSHWVALRGRSRRGDRVHRHRSRSLCERTTVPSYVCCLARCTPLTICAHFARVLQFWTRFAHVVWGVLCVPGCLAPCLETLTFIHLL